MELHNLAMDTRRKLTKFDKLMGIRLPDGFKALVVSAAAKKHMKFSEYVRAAIREKMERDKS